MDLKPVNIILVAVAAAASVPSSFTSMKALWKAALMKKESSDGGSTMAGATATGGGA